MSEDYRNNAVYADNHSRRPPPPAPNQQPNNYRKYRKPKNEKHSMKLEAFFRATMCILCCIYVGFGTVWGFILLIADYQVQFIPAFIFCVYIGFFIFSLYIMF
jgi:hypothetical protein